MGRPFNGIDRNQRKENIDRPTSYADLPVWVLKEIIEKKYRTLVTAANKNGENNSNVADRVIIPNEGERVVLMR